jgi:hypothetical protein
MCINEMKINLHTQYSKQSQGSNAKITLHVVRIYKSHNIYVHVCKQTSTAMLISSFTIIKL